MEKEIFKYKPRNINEKWHKHDVVIPCCINRKEYENHNILLETHGILSSFGIDFSRILVNYVGNHICPIFDINDTTEPDTIIPDIDSRPLFKQFVFDYPLDWVDKVYIYATTSFDDSGVLLCNNDGKVYDIICNGQRHPSYFLDGTRLRYMSIIVSSDLQHVDKYHIAGIIKHEMKHGYDLIRKDFMSNELNRDIKFFYDTLKPSKIKYYTKYYNYSKTDLHTFLNSLTCEELYELIRDMIYYLNTSEIQARLNNFENEVLKLKEDGDLSRFGEDTLQVYGGLRNVLNELELIPKTTKEEFSKNYMKQFSDVYAGVRKTLSGKDVVLFSNYGKWNEKSFDKLLSFFMSKINNFIRKCHAIYCDNIDNAKFPNINYTWNNIINQLILSH